MLYKWGRPKLSSRYRLGDTWQLVQTRQAHEVVQSASIFTPLPLAVNSPSSCRSSMSGAEKSTHAHCMGLFARIWGSNAPVVTLVASRRDFTSLHDSITSFSRCTLISLSLFTSRAVGQRAFHVSSAIHTECGYCTSRCSRVP